MLTRWSVGLTTIRTRVQCSEEVNRLACVLVITVRFGFTQGAPATMLWGSGWAQKESTMNTRIQKTLASIFAAASLTLALPLAASAEETAQVQAHVAQVTQPNPAQRVRIRQLARATQGAHQAVRASGASLEAPRPMRPSTVTVLRASVR